MDPVNVLKNPDDHTLFPFALYVQPEDMNGFFKERRWHPKASTLNEFLHTHDEDTYGNFYDMEGGLRVSVKRALPFYYESVLDALMNRVLVARRAFRETLNTFYDVRSSVNGTNFALAHRSRVGFVKISKHEDIMNSMSVEGCEDQVPDLEL